MKKENAMDKWKKTLKYVQFSKKMIVSISLGLFVLSLIGMYMCYSVQDGDSIVKIVTIDGYYAIFAFVAYSGNSMLEKWLIKKFGGILGSELNCNDTETEDTNSEEGER